MARIYKRGRIWWEAWYAEGEKHYRSLRTADRRVALYKKAQHEQDLARGQRNDLSGNLTFSEACKLYKESSIKRKGANTIRIDGWMLRQFEDRIGSEKMSSLRPAQLEALLDQLSKDRKLSVVSRNNYLKVLRALGTWLVGKGHLFENPTKGIGKLPVSEKLPTYLTKDQRDKLMKTCRNHYLYPAVMTALFGGLRWEEIARLEWSDVDFGQKVIRIQPKKDWTPKSKQARVIPLNQTRLRPVLWKIRQKEGSCFPAPGGDRYRTRARYAIKKWLKEIGAYRDREGWHLLRRTFGSTLFQVGVPMQKIMYWLGHTGAIPKPTDRYLVFQPGYDPEIEKLG